MIYRDPTHQILKAYVNLLKGTIIYNGAPVPVGTRITQGATEYVLIQVDDIENQGHGAAPIYRAYISLIVTSQQDITEGDETPGNVISEQLLEIISDPEVFLMTDFKCIMVMPLGLERDSELTDSNYNIIRNLKMINYVEQLK